MMSPSSKRVLCRRQRTRFYYTVAKLLFIVLSPIVLLLLPADFFDNGRSICLSQLIFGMECYACGLTRGIMHLIHLDFENAFAYNMASFIVFPLMILIWIQWFFKELRIYKKLKTALFAYAGIANPALYNQAVEKGKKEVP